MGLFRKKTKKTQPDVLNISGKQLISLIEKAVSLAIEDIEARCYTTGPEIMFEYNDEIHFIGIKYDKKRARAEKKKSFSYELMSFYLDKDCFANIEELGCQSRLHGTLLQNIEDGIVVGPEYKELLWRMQLC